MVILFSDRKSKTEKEIIKILMNCGVGYVSDKIINYSKNGLTVISEYKPTALNVKRGIAVITENTACFEKQFFPKGIIGICESENKNALKVFENNKTPVITCGMNPKSTVTFSSINNDSILLSLQRTVKGINRTETEPQEIKIKLNHKYETFSVMASAVILLLYGKKPTEF